MPTNTIEAHALGPVDAIPAGEGRNYRVDGTEVAVFRTRAGDIFATQAHCPHRGAPLADGLVGGSVVVCPFHSFSFALDTGEAVTGPCPALKVYPTWVENDNLFVVLDEPDEEFLTNVTR